MPVGFYDKDDTKVKGVNKAGDAEEIDSYKEQLKTADILDCAAVYGEITVGTSAVEVKVGASVLADRKCVHMFAKDNAIYWGYDNTVTTVTGTRIFKGQLVIIDVGEDVSVWVIGDVATRKMNIGELS